MSVLDKVRAAKKATEERLSRGGGSGSNAKFWRPEAGENVIRIMPAWTQDASSLFYQQFWREVAQHWGVSKDQKGPILCPKNTPGLKGDCPICDFVEELKADKTNVDGVKIARNIRAKTAYLMNIVDKKDPVYTATDVAEFAQSNPDKDCPFAAGDLKVQIYACPISIFDNILGMVSTTGDDITDADSGREITITKIPHKDKFKTRYQVMPAFKPASVASEFGLDEFKVETLPALENVGYQLAYDKLLDLLHEGVGGDFAGALPEGSSEAVGALSQPAVSTSTSSTTETGGGSVDLEEQMRRELAKS